MKAQLMGMEDIAAPSTPGALPDRMTYWEMSRLVADLMVENRKLRQVNEAISPWLSEALNDEQVCPEMKAVVEKWIEANK